MGDFLHGWRRKAGFATLVMALMVLAAWVRSNIASDMVTRETARARTILMSAKYSLVWYFEEFGPTETGGDDLMIAFGNAPGWNVPPRWDSKWQFAGFFIGERHIAGGREACWIIPYWSIVVPLTLLSAYLLLSRPRL